jgi:hypothetical protein
MTAMECAAIFDLNVVFELSQKIGFDNNKENVFTYLANLLAYCMHRRSCGSLFKVFNPDSGAQTPHFAGK